MAKRLTRIYTRKGDNGSTAMADGQRLDKDHPRVEAIGEVDSLNSQLGLALASLAEQTEQHPQLQQITDMLAPCQHRLFDIGGELSMPEYQSLQESEITALEQAIDRCNVELDPLRDFILPGGSRLVAELHLVRSQARQAERRCCTLHRQEPLRPVVLGYINRLSDLLFLAARLSARYQGTTEVLWQPKRPE